MAMRGRDRDAEGVGDADERLNADVGLDNQGAMIDRGPAGATFQVVTVQDRAQVPVRYVKLVIAVIAIMVVAIAGTNLLPSSADVDGSGVADSPSPSPSSSSAVTVSEPPSSEILPGKFLMAGWQRGVELTVPAGWSSTDDGRSIYKTFWGSFGGPGLGVYDVTHVVADVCPPEPSYVEVGPTAEDLATALGNVAGLERSGPIDVVLGGYPARKFVFTTPQGFGLTCYGGGEGRSILENVNATESNFGVLSGGTATIYVVDVEGDRLVIASHYRGAGYYQGGTAEDSTELEAIIASIYIENRRRSGSSPG